MFLSDRQQIRTLRFLFFMVKKGSFLYNDLEKIYLIFNSKSDIVGMSLSENTLRGKRCN